jgi:hypothetical protein
VTGPELLRRLSRIKKMFQLKKALTSAKNVFQFSEGGKKSEKKTHQLNQQFDIKFLTQSTKNPIVKMTLENLPYDYAMIFLFFGVKQKG